MFGEDLTLHLSWKTSACCIHSLLSASLCALCVNWGRELTGSTVPSQTVVPPYREGSGPRNVPSPYTNASVTRFPGNEISDWWLLLQEEIFGTDPASSVVKLKGKKNLSDSLRLQGGFALNTNKKYIITERGIHKQKWKKKKRKSDGLITNSSEAGRDCSNTSYIILSICIVRLEQQQSRCFEIKNNLEGANKLTVCHIVERERENLYLAIINTRVCLLIESAQPSSRMWQWQLNSSSRVMDLIVLQL